MKGSSVDGDGEPVDREGKGKEKKGGGGPRKNPLRIVDSPVIQKPIKWGRISRAILSAPIYFDSFTTPATELPSTYSLDALDGEGDEDDWQEVLVVGATGELGQEIIRRLARAREYKVRVLVRNLYSSTISKVGAGAVYCYGDVMGEGLDVAVTDVDKILYVCGTAASKMGEASSSSRAVNFDGLNNVIRTLQDVRYTDFGLKDGAAKRTLFKFTKKQGQDVKVWAVQAGAARCKYVTWKQNKGNNGVFAGELFEDNKRGVTLFSGKLTQREVDGEGDKGLDLSGFGGLLVRGCGDGSKFMAVVRTGQGEWEYSFETSVSANTVVTEEEDQYRSPKFTTFNFPWSMFVNERGERGMDARDIRQIGFRFKGREKDEPGRPKGKFYLSLSYIKVYKATPEPEIIYVSDGRLPTHVGADQVNENLEQIVLQSDSDGSLFEEGEEQLSIRDSSREMFWKYKGEQSLINSGLGYSIMRVNGYDETQSVTSKLTCQSTDEGGVNKVSRKDVAEVCYRALGDPRVTNKMFYVNKVDTGKVQLASGDSDVFEKFHDGVRE